MHSVETLPLTDLMDGRAVRTSYGRPQAGRQDRLP